MRDRVGILALVFSSFFLMGAVATLVGATLPVMVREFQWSYGTAGLLLAGNAAGYFCFTILSGFLLPQWGTKYLLVFGLGCQGVGIFLFGGGFPWTAQLALLTLVGVGQGMIEVGANCVAIQLDGPGQSRLMNLVHSAFTVGAVSAPILVGIVLTGAQSWRLVYGAFGIISVVLAWVTFRRKFPACETVTRGRQRYRLFREGMILWCGLGILLYVGIEMGISSWVAEFYVVQFGGEKASAAFLVSLFWLGILVGRVATGLCYRGRRHGLVLLLSGTLTVIGCAGMLLLGWAAAFYTSVFVSALGLSVIYPTIMVMVGERFSEDRGLSVGIVASGGGVGAFVFPLAIGWLAESMSLWIGYSIFGSMSVVMLVVCAVISRRSLRVPNQLF